MCVCVWGGGGGGGGEWLTEGGGQSGFKLSRLRTASSHPKIVSKQFR